MLRGVAGLALALLLGLAALGVPPAGALVQVGQPAPEIAGPSWINSEPLTLSALRGRVVLVEFWTYG
jgi:hypothetical protein